MRGEYTVEAEMALEEKGSPPHARGILNLCPFAGRNAGITPACAGNTRRPVEKL